MSDNTPYDCLTCTDKLREARNCHNKKQYENPILLKSEWKTISTSHRDVLKIGDLKFFECPVSTINRKTWDIISLVNETTDGEGNILHLPFVGTILEQPDWYRQSVRILKKERADNQRERLNRGK